MHASAKRARPPRAPAGILQILSAAEKKVVPKKTVEGSAYGKAAFPFENC